VREGRVIGLHRKALAWLRGKGFDYSCFKVFTLSLDEDSDIGVPALPAGYRFVDATPDDLRASAFEELRVCAWYGGPGSQLFAIAREDGTLACVQCVWFGERYGQRSFWPLAAGEAASMHLVTVPRERGRGLATLLKQQSAAMLRKKGFTRIYSRIWWTNRPSLRVSEKAGWAHVGTIVDVLLPWRKAPFRLAIGARGAPPLAADPHTRVR
jgi:RimJ/RimL family protein N-acetyltransferase